MAKQSTPDAFVPLIYKEKPGISVPGVRVSNENAKPYTGKGASPSSPAEKEKLSDHPRVVI